MFDRRSPMPRYQQIADDLKQRVSALEAGTRLPSEPQLAREFAVSRFTIAKAVEQLADEGLLTRRQGSGTFVAEAPLRRAPGYMLSFSEAVAAAGRTLSHRVLAFGPVAWAEGMSYPADEPLVRLDRLRFVDGVAVACHRSILSGRVVAQAGLSREVVEAPSFSLYRHLEEAGLSVQSATERLVACPASEDDRKLLGLQRGGVVVSVSRDSFAADGAVLDSVSAIYDARKYSYEARLVRPHRPGNQRNRMENDDVVQTYARDRHAGPHLGPWGDGGDR